jgi:hypothetical protein
MPHTISTTEGKTFSPLCAECRKRFTSDNARTKYCSLVCKKANNNRTYYEHHAEIVSTKNNDRQKRQRALAQLYEESSGDRRKSTSKSE